MLSNPQWVGIGFNVSGLGTGGLWAVVFHISLGGEIAAVCAIEFFPHISLSVSGIFVVYYLFWWKLVSIMHSSKGHGFSMVLVL